MQLLQYYCKMTVFYMLTIDNNCQIIFVTLHFSYHLLAIKSLLSQLPYHLKL